LATVQNHHSGPVECPIQVQVLSSRATIPRYQTPGSAGMDLSACLPEGQTLTVLPGQIVRVPLGFAVSFPSGFEVQIRPRSGLATKRAITIPNSPGTVDSDYRGEMVVALINLGGEAFVVEHGMRIAQMVVAPVARAQVRVVDGLDETQRGAGGFGSTGTH
jgi:dUTP pyrophosphatase